MTGRIELTANTYASMEMEQAAPRFVPGLLRFRGVMIGLACLAAGISGYLAWTALTATKVMGCGGDLFDCSHVLTSRWSTVFGIPVGLPAAALYVVLLASLVALPKLSTKRRQILEGVIVAGVFCAGLAAVWFISLQVFSIGHLCPWCLTAHACGVVLSGLVLWARPFAWASLGKIGAVSTTLVSGLVLAQVLGPVPETFEVEHHEAPVDNDAPLFSPDDDDDTDAGAPEARFNRARHEDTVARAGMHPLMILVLLVSLISRMLETTTHAQEPPRSGQTKDDDAKPEARIVLLKGGTKLDSHQWPIVGDPKADYVFVHMFDYTCPHCRAAHAGAVRGALKHYGDRLAIIMLSVPLDAKCNKVVQTTIAGHEGACELSRIAVAVFKADRRSFAKFHDWLMSAARTPAAAREQAAELVGADRLNAQLADPKCAKMVERQVELYRLMGSGSVPKMLFPRATVTGDIGSAETLINTIGREARQ